METTTDAWGVLQSGTPGLFGFTGELQQGGDVYLRARWYNAASGTFTSRDPWAGDDQRPNTLALYTYAANNPILMKDPSGQCYDPIAFLRSVEPLNCSNLDKAIAILQNPNTSGASRTFAQNYAAAFIRSHGILLIGAGILGGAAAAEGAAAVTTVAQWGASHIAAGTATGTWLSGGLTTLGAAGIVDTAYHAVQGDPLAQAFLACPGAFGAATLWTDLGELMESVLARIDGQAMRRILFTKEQGGGFIKWPRKIINQTTNDRYLIYDSDNLRLQAIGILDSQDMLEITLRTVLEDGERTPLFKDTEQFNKIARFFHRRMSGIKGNWQYGDNLDTFNASLLAGMSFEDVARSTWTGQRAWDLGYTQVSLDVTIFSGAFGHYNHVTVYFLKPQ